MKKLGDISIAVGLVALAWIVAGLVARVLFELFMLGWGVL